MHFYVLLVDGSRFWGNFGLGLRFKFSFFLGYCCLALLAGEPIASAAELHDTSSSPTSSVTGARPLALPSLDGPQDPHALLNRLSEATSQFLQSQKAIEDKAGEVNAAIWKMVDQGKKDKESMVVILNLRKSVIEDLATLFKDIYPLIRNEKDDPKTLAEFFEKHTDDITLGNVTPALRDMLQRYYKKYFDDAAKRLIERTLKLESPSMVAEDYFRFGYEPSLSGKRAFDKDDVVANLRKLRENIADVSSGVASGQIDPNLLQQEEEILKLEAVQGHPSHRAMVRQLHQSLDSRIPPQNRLALHHLPAETLSELLQPENLRTLSVEGGHLTSRRADVTRKLLDDGSMEVTDRKTEHSHHEDLAGRITLVRDAKGREFRFKYDNYGLTEYTDPVTRTTWTKKDGVWTAPGKTPFRGEVTVTPNHLSLTPSQTVQVDRFSDFRWVQARNRAFYVTQDQNYDPNYDGDDQADKITRAMAAFPARDQIESLWYLRHNTEEFSIGDPQLRNAAKKNDENFRESLRTHLKNSGVDIDHVGWSDSAPGFNFVRKHAIAAQRVNSVDFASGKRSEVTLDPESLSVLRSRYDHLPPSIRSEIAFADWLKVYKAAKEAKYQGLMEGYNQLSEEIFTNDPGQTKSDNSEHFLRNVAMLSEAFLKADRKDQTLIRKHLSLVYEAIVKRQVLIEQKRFAELEKLEQEGELTFEFVVDRLNRYLEAGRLDLPKGWVGSLAIRPLFNLANGLVVGARKQPIETAAAVVLSAAFPEAAAGFYGGITLVHSVPGTINGFAETRQGMLTGDVEQRDRGLEKIGDGILNLGIAAWAAKSVTKRPPRSVNLTASESEALARINPYLKKPLPPGATAAEMEEALNAIPAARRSILGRETGIPHGERAHIGDLIRSVKGEPPFKPSVATSTVTATTESAEAASVTAQKAQRAARAREILRKEFPEGVPQSVLDAVEEAHGAETIIQKAKALRRQNVSWQGIRELMENWVVGNARLSRIENTQILKPLERIRELMPENKMTASFGEPAANGDFTSLVPTRAAENGHMAGLTSDQVNSLVESAIKDPRVPHRWYSYDKTSKQFYRLVDRSGSPGISEPQLSVESKADPQLVKGALGVNGDNVQALFEANTSLQRGLNAHKVRLGELPESVGSGSNKLPLKYRPSRPRRDAAGNLVPAEPFESAWHITGGEDQVRIHDVEALERGMSEMGANHGLGKVSKDEVVSLLRALDRGQPEFATRPWNKGTLDVTDALQINGKTVQVRRFHDPQHGSLPEEMVMTVDGKQWVVRRLTDDRNLPNGVLQPDLNFEVKIKDKTHMTLDSTRASAPRVYIQFSATTGEVRVWTAVATH